MKKYSSQLLSLMFLMGISIDHLEASAPSQGMSQRERQREKRIQAVRGHELNEQVPNDRTTQTPANTNAVRQQQQPQTQSHLSQVYSQGMSQRERQREKRIQAVRGHELNEQVPNDRTTQTPANTNAVRQQQRPQPQGQQQTPQIWPATSTPRASQQQQQQRPQPQGQQQVPQTRSATSTPRASQQQQQRLQRLQQQLQQTQNETNQLLGKVQGLIQESLQGIRSSVANEVQRLGTENAIQQLSIEHLQELKSLCCEMLEEYLQKEVLSGLRPIEQSARNLVKGILKVANILQGRIGLVDNVLQSSRGIAVGPDHQIDLLQSELDQLGVMNQNALNQISSQIAGYAALHLSNILQKIDTGKRSFFGGNSVQKSHKLRVATSDNSTDSSQITSLISSGRQQPRQQGQQQQIATSNVALTPQQVSSPGFQLGNIGSQQKEHISDDEDPFVSVSSISLLSAVNLPKPSNPSQNVQGKGLPSIKHNPPLSRKLPVTIAVSTNTDEAKNNATNRQGNEVNSPSDKRSGQGEKLQEMGRALYNSVMDSYNMWKAIAVTLCNSPQDSDIKESEQAARRLAEEALQKVTGEAVEPLLLDGDIVKEYVGRIHKIPPFSNEDWFYGDSSKFLENFARRLMNEDDAFDQVPQLPHPIKKRERGEKENRKDDEHQNLVSKTLQQEQQVDQINLNLETPPSNKTSQEASQKGNSPMANQLQLSGNQQGKDLGNVGISSSAPTVPLSSDVEFSKPDILPQNIHGNSASPTEQKLLLEQSSIKATIPSDTDKQGNEANNDHNEPPEISPIKTEKGSSCVLSQQNSLSDGRDSEEEEEEEQYGGDGAYPQELNDLYDSVIVPFNDWQDAAENFWNNPNDNQAKKDEEDARKCSTEALSKITLDRINELEQKYGRGPLNRLANEMQGTLDDPENDFQDDTRKFLENFRDRLQKQEGAFERADFLLCPVAVSGEEGTGDNQRGASKPATPIHLKKSATPEAKTPRRNKEAQLPILTVYYFIQDLNVIQKCGKDILELNEGEKAQFFVGNPEGQKHRETLYNAVLNPKTNAEKKVESLFSDAMPDDAIAKLWNEQRAERAKSDKDKKEWENKKKRQASLTERKAQLRNEYKEAKNSDQDPSDKQLLVWLLKRFASQEMTKAMAQVSTLKPSTSNGTVKKGSQSQEQKTLVPQVLRLDETKQLLKEGNPNIKSPQIETQKKQPRGSTNSKEEDYYSDYYYSDEEPTPTNNKKEEEEEDPNIKSQQTETQGQQPNSSTEEKEKIQTNDIPESKNELDIPEEQEDEEVSSDPNAPGNPPKPKNIFTTSFVDLVKEQQRREEVFTILKACNFFKTLAGFPQKAKQCDLCNQQQKETFCSVLGQKKTLQIMSSSKLSDQQKKEKDDMERKLSCLTQEQFNEMSSKDTSNRRKKALSVEADTNLLDKVIEYLTSTEVDTIRADLASYKKWKQDRRENAQQSRRSDNPNSSSSNNE